jgi:predicted PurR-regulated permease PerM
MENIIYNLDLSWKTIFRIIFAVGLVFLLLVLRDIWVSLIFAFVLAILLKSAIVFFYRLKIPYWVSAVITYSLVFGLIGLVLYISAPLIFLEIRNMALLLPGYFEEISPFLSSLGLEIEGIGSWVQEALIPQAPGGIVQALGSIMGGLATTFFVFLMALFISLEKKGVESVISFLAPAKHQSKVIKAWTRSRRQVTYWFGSRIICSLFIMAAYFLTYQLLGVNAAFILALIAGVANFIPYIGSLLATLLGVAIVGLQFNWMTALLAFAILFILQAIESYILGPILTRKMNGLPPYLILLSLAIGGSLFGMVGAFLAIPMTAIIYQFVLDIKGGEYRSEETENEILPEV